MRRFTKILLIFTVTIVALSGALIGGAYWYVTHNDVKDILALAVKKTTGHDLYIMGEAKLEIFPKPVFYATDVRIPAFNGDNPIFTAQKIDLEAKWGFPPFFWKGVELVRLNVDSPTVFLKENKKGLANWESAVRGRDGFSGLGSGDSDSSGGMDSLKSIGAVSLSNLHFTYEGDKTGTNIDLKNLNLTVDGQDLSDTQIQASGNLNNQNLALNGNVNMKNENRPVQMHVSVAGSEINFNGVLAPQPQGSISLIGNNLRKTLSSFVEPAAVSNVPSQSFMFKADISQEKDTKSFKNLAIEIGQSLAMQGKIELVDRGRKSPLLNGNLVFSRLDLDKLQLCGTTASKTSSSSDESYEWSDTPVDLSFIRQANWDISVKALNMSCQDFPVQSFTSQVKNDGLTVNIDQLNLQFPKDGQIATKGYIKYGNRVVGQMNTTLSQLPIESFLAQPGELRLPIDGDIQLNMDGRSIKEIMENLSGHLKATSQNAVLPAKKLEAISLKLSTVMGGARTANANMVADFTIDKGIADTNKFLIKTTDNFLSIGGEGKIDLGHKSIAYKLTPNVEAEGGLFKGGVAIPVTVQGRWNNIKVRPDSSVTKTVATGVGAVVGGPAGAVIGNTIGGALSGDQNAIGDAVKGVSNFITGGNKEEDGSATDSNTESSGSKAGDAVENLIKGFF